MSTPSALARSANLLADPVVAHHPQQCRPHLELGECDGLVGALASEHLAAPPHPRAGARRGHLVDEQHEVTGDLPDDHDLSRLHRDTTPLIHRRAVARGVGNRSVPWVLIRYACGALLQQRDDLVIGSLAEVVIPQADCPKPGRYHHADDLVSLIAQGGR